MDKIIYSTKEAAEILKVTPRTIQLWSDSGLLEAGKTPGGHRRIKGESIWNLLASMEDSTPTGNTSNPVWPNLFLIDDDKAFIDLLSIKIKKWNLPVNILCAQDGYEALLEMGHTLPEIIITDLNMPHMDGFHMLDMIKSNNLLKSSHICVLTGLDSAQISEQGKLPSDIVVLQKPVNFDRLKNFLNHALVSETPTMSKAKLS